MKANDRGLPATLVTVPAGEALPHRLLLERALKPFLRRYPSRRLTVLDELATAEVSAERQNATPVYSPAPERWFDIAMLVEDSDAMSVWAETIRELHGLFERHGAFRQVRMWMYTVRGGEFMLSTAAGQPALPHVVADPEGRRLCLFLTDGTHRCSLWSPIIWRHGPALLCHRGDPWLRRRAWSLETLQNLWSRRNCR